ncbi:hypothetical protein Golomagni_01272 [Golovinomyces magnicellulatus]|nr:hypothetical protein Golomagni_01272 [Golovinomyces magnicellulatus]
MNCVMMAEKVASTLKISGVFSLGLLTGFSYSMSTLILPTILSVCTSNNSSNITRPVSKSSANHLRILTFISSSSLFLAYILSPRTQKHPYLLWATLFASSSFVVDLYQCSQNCSHNFATSQESVMDSKVSARIDRRLDSSYEVLSKVNQSDDDENEEKIEHNEESHYQLKSLLLTERVRTTLTSAGFIMSIVGIWGDRFSGFMTGV